LVSLLLVLPALLTADMQVPVVVVFVVHTANPIVPK